MAATTNFRRRASGRPLGASWGSKPTSGWWFLTRVVGPLTRTWAHTPAIDVETRLAGLLLFETSDAFGCRITARGSVGTR
jgi:hypothetical protein